VIQITRLPEEVKRFLVPLKPLFSYRHFLVFCWLIVAHLVCFEKATFKALGRYTPKHIAWWHLRRLVACSRWPWEAVLEGLVSQCLFAFPPPGDGVLYLVVDSTLKGKRTQKNPLAKKGRLSGYTPYTFGLHLVLLIAQWDVYRIPLTFRLVKPKKSKGYRSENALFREMLEDIGAAPLVQDDCRGGGCGLCLAGKSQGHSSARVVLCHCFPAHLEAG
jgi:hypothetical protein